MRFSRVVATLAAVLGATTSANADPLTLAYSVRTQSCDVEDNTAAGRPDVRCSPDPSLFSLTVTFDTTVLRAETTPTAKSYEFGAPTFSAVPLVLPSLPSVRDTNDFTTYNEFSLPDQQIRNVSFSAQRFFFSDRRTYDHSVSLFAFDELGLTDLPPLEGLLSLARELEFSYVYREYESGESANIVALRYRGIAALQADVPEPVPEPSSLLLFSTGAAALGRIAWRRRSRHTH
jgi:PEP-CTERM motif